MTFAKAMLVVRANPELLEQELVEYRAKPGAWATVYLHSALSDFLSGRTTFTKLSEAYPEETRNPCLIRIRILTVPTTPPSTK